MPTTTINSRKNVKFIDGKSIPKWVNPEGLEKYSAGNEASKKRVESPEDVAAITAAYTSSGIPGVMSLLEIKKTQAYELVGKLGLRKKKNLRKQKARALQYGRNRRSLRLEHLYNHYGWTPGMNACFLNSFVKMYPATTIIAGITIMPNHPVCVSSLPAPAVREYMERFGLTYYVTKAGVTLCADVSRNAKNLISTVSKKLLNSRSE